MSGDPASSLSPYREQITGALKTYELSLRSWTLRRKVYKELLQGWDAYGQLRQNPVDGLRLEFMDAEIVKQENKLSACKDNLKKFEDLEKQLMDLAAATPVPSSDVVNLANDETLMEIREDLDDDDNIVSSSVTPQNTEAFGHISKALALTPESGLEKTVTNGQAISTNGSVEPLVSAPASDEHEDFEPPPIPVSKATKSPVKKQKKKKNASPSASTDASTDERIVEINDDDVTSDTPKVSPVSDTIVEREVPSPAPGTYGIRETENGGIVITDDPDGYSIGILPQGLAEMTEIVNEMDWDRDVEHDDEEDSEDEFGRAKHRGMIPLPGLLSRPSSSQEARFHIVEHHRRNSAEKITVPITSAVRKKKLVFADKLVQGPSAGTAKMPAKSVLKKQSAYPITAEYDDQTPPATPTIMEPKKSRFKLERSSTDTRIAQQRALPSQIYQETLGNPVSDVVERKLPNVTDSERDPSPAAYVEVSPAAAEAVATGNISQVALDAMSTEERDRLYPRKINLAGVDLNPEDGTVKATMSIPKLSEEALAAIRKKRESMGKKHKRRKSADPNYPVRSGSWDDSQPLQKPHRRPSTGELEEPGETMKATRLERVKELLKAQDDIAWANSPISPDDLRADSINANNPLADAGQALKDELSAAPKERHESPAEAQIDGGNDPLDSAVLNSGSATPPNQVSQSSPPQVLSPRPRKPPTPERRGSYANIPSPLSQEIQPHSSSKEVQFSSDVIRRLEPLMEHETMPTVVATQVRERKKPPRQPVRKSSVDPQNITPTPGSPPPDGRRPGPLQTEEEGSVSHYMIRATTKSPPPHIAIHDLLGETPEHVARAVKMEAISPSPEYKNPVSSVLNERANEIVHNRESQEADKDPSTVAQKSSKKVVHGIVETTQENDVGADDTSDEIDDAMHRKEIAQEYHRLRARMIGRDGGFVQQENDSGIVPLDGEDPGPGKRVSRFMAARLGQRD